MKTKRTALTQFRYETQIIETRNIDLHGFFNLFLLLAVHRDYSYLDQHLFAHFSRVLPFHDIVSQWAMGNGQWVLEINDRGKNVRRTKTNLKDRDWVQALRVRKVSHTNDLTPLCFCGQLEFDNFR